MLNSKPLKKVLLSILMFVVFVAAVSTPIISCYLNGSSVADNDISGRDYYAGTIDTFIVGASQVEYGLDPKIINEKTGLSSYNMSCAWQNLYGERILMRQELARNPVETVYIGVCLDTLTRTEDSDGGQGDVIMFPRLSGFSDKMEYMFEVGQLSDLPSMYFHYMHYGTISLIKHLRGIDDSLLDLENRGFVPYLLPAESMVYTPGSIASMNAYYEHGVTEDNASNLIALIRQCQEAGARVVLFATPLTEVFLEQFDKWDEFLNKIIAIADEAGEGIEVIDFNLYKQRSEIFEDSTDFYNGSHLNAAGAEKFSEIFAEVISKEDYSEDFYESYQEMDSAAK